MGTAPGGTADPWCRSRRLPGAALLVGIVGLVGLALGGVAVPDRAFLSYLTAYAYAVSLAVGALLLLMIAHVTDARWFVVFRRVSEAVAGVVPVLALLFLPLLFGLDHLYPWVPPFQGLEPPAVELVAQKQVFLNVPFFVARAALYFAVWVSVSHVLLSWSARQDREPLPELTQRLRTLSAVALPAVAFALTFAAFDWLMSLSVEWSSTIWGVYYFAGGFVAALALIVVLSFLLERAGPLDPDLSPAHYRVLGNLILTFVIFWGYIAYSQYFIVWIAGIPAEVGWYIPRIRTSWRWLALLLILGHLVLPFIVLLFRRFRGSPAGLAALGGWILLMHYADLYWLIVPARYPDGIAVHWLDVAALASVSGVTLAYGSSWLRRRPLVPIGDPQLGASIEYESRGAGSTHGSRRAS